MPEDGQQQKRKKHLSHNINKSKNEGRDIHKRLRIFSDGGARGNPGPAAIAFMILSDDGQVLAASSRYIGVCTNNCAEYEALTAALESASGFHPDEVVCHLDSELVTRQLTGKYRVKDAVLKRKWQKVQVLKSRFATIQFVSVPRSHEFIEKVDELLNRTLDESA